MGRQMLANGKYETLDQAESRVMRRTLKHYAMAVAIIGGTVFGVAEGGKEIAESKAPYPQQSRDSSAFSLGVLWLALASLGGATGAAVMLPRIVKDQRSLERIERSRQLQSNEISTCRVAKKSLYQKNVDGQYETYGEAHQRIQKKMRMEFAGAAALTVVGASLILDAMINKPILTGTILPWVGHGASQGIAGIVQALSGTASFSQAAVLAAAGSRHLSLSHRVEVDKNHFGENMRSRSRAVSVERSGTEPS